MLINTKFMQKKFKVKEAFTLYLRQTYLLSKQYQLSMAEKASLKRYLNAIKTLRDARVLDIAQCAIKLGRNLTGKPLEIWQALPVIIGRGVISPNKIDLEYAKIRLAYATSLEEHKNNIKDWVLGFVLTNQYSPVRPYFESQLKKVIQETEHNIMIYENQLNSF